MRSRNHSGFTLIELLVVIAIISILAAIMMPVYAKMKQSGKRSVCQSNLSQMAKAFEGYMSDYNGCYPADVRDQYLWSGRHWRWPMKKYLCFYAAYDASDANGANQITRITNTILRCPADPDPIDKYDKTSYGYSAAFYHTPEQINTMDKYCLYLDPANPRDFVPVSVVRSSMVTHPSKKALVAEWKSYHSEKVVTWWSWDGERNYLFADGHLKYLSARTIKPAVDDLPDINLTINGVAGKDVD